MYYRTSPRRLKKIRRPVQHNPYSVPPRGPSRVGHYAPPYHRSGYVHRAPRYSAAPRRQRVVRTHGLKVLLFLIMLAILGWYSGLIPAGIAKLEATLSPAAPQTALVYPGQHSIQGAPTISAAKIDSILCSAGSPACGSGQEIYHLGVTYNINPAYALAFFQHESSFGLAGAARSTHSLGNLRCIPNYPCPNGYASFPTWSEGFQAWYSLIDSNVYVRSGHTSIETIIPVYAPSGDNNDVNAYINSVVGAVESWEK